jgi:signal transduction histidine kinase
MSTASHPENIDDYDLHLKSYRLTKKKHRTLQELACLATELTGCPIAVITIKEQGEIWFKAQHGILIKSNDAINTLFFKNIEQDSDILEIEDLSKHLSENDCNIGAKNNVAFYAGSSLISAKNIPIGTISVFDYSPRRLSNSQLISLQTISDLIVKQLLLRKRNLELSETSKLLKENNELLAQFAHVVSHDMKMPLSSMILTVDVLKKKITDNDDLEFVKYLDVLKESAFNLSGYIDNILSHYESDNLLKDEKDVTDCYTMCESVAEIIAMADDVLYTLPEENMVITCNTAALLQILLNLVGNSLKYNDKDQVQITIKVKEDDSFYYFQVRDNGVGIPKSKQKEIFKLFTTLGTVDRYGKSGNGIGLSTVYKLVSKMGGKIKVKSKKGEGANFKFSISK